MKTEEHIISPDADWDWLEQRAIEKAKEVFEEKGFRKGGLLTEVPNPWHNGPWIIQGFSGKFVSRLDASGYDRILKMEILSVEAPHQTLELTLEQAVEDFPQGSRNPDIKSKIAITVARINAVLERFGI